MFLQLKHKSLNTYKAIRELAKEIYKVSKLLPQEEKFNMVPQMRRAALSVKLNLPKVHRESLRLKEKDFLKLREDL